MKTATFASLRRTRAEFMARGLASREAGQRSGVYFASEAVHAELAQMLAKARAKAKAPKSAKRARG